MDHCTNATAIPVNAAGFTCPIRARSGLLFPVFGSPVGPILAAFATGVSSISVVLNALGSRRARI